MFPNIASSAPLKFGDAAPSTALGGTSSNRSDINVSTGGSKTIIFIACATVIGLVLWHKYKK